MSDLGGSGVSAAQSPRMTVGVPVYNAQQFLAETLDHLLSQSFADFEIVISDNASTDATQEMCRQYAKLDSRIRYSRSEINRGLAWNFNRTLELARGEYFTWNASDDVGLPAHLERCVQALDAQPATALALARVQLIDAMGRVVGELEDRDLALSDPDPAVRAREYSKRQAFHCIGYGGVMRTSVLRGFGGLPDYYGGDLILGLRMAIAFPFAVLDEQLYQARRHPAQSSNLQTASIDQQVTQFADGRRTLLYLPQWRMNAEMMGCALTSPIPPLARAQSAVAVLTGWTLPHWRLLLFDIKRNVNHLYRAARARRPKPERR